MSGLGRYRTLLSDRQARGFSAAGLLARLQISMTGLSIVLLVSLQTGSFARAGLVTAVATISGAAVTPGWGRLLDRIGQARVLVATSSIFALGICGLITAVLVGASLPVTLAAAVLVGLGISQAGVAVRARWSHRLPEPADRDVAFALEAVIDEVIFILGPVLATLVATTVHPAAGLVLCAICTLTGGLALAAQRSSQPPTARRDDRRIEDTIDPRPLLPLVISCAALGMIFGGMEVAVVAYATERQILPFTSVILMCWALGSLVAGVITGTITWRASPTRRFRISAVALACSLVPLPFLTHPLPLVAVLVVSGLAIAPTLIASVAVVQQLVPASRFAESLSWTQLGLASGVAAGGAGIGWAVDGWQAFGGFVGLTAAAAFLVLGALLVRSRAVIADS